MKVNDIRVGSFIAYKSITKGNKSVSVLLIGVLALVFFNLLFVKAFLAGFAQGVLDSMIDTTTSHITVLPQEKPFQKKFIINQSALRKSIETIPGVIATTRHYLMVGAVASDRDKTGRLRYVSAPIVGIDQAEDGKVMRLRETIVSGDFPDTLGDKDIILGSNLAGGFPESPQSVDLGGVRAGEKVYVGYPNGVSKTYTTKGVFKVTIGFASNNAFISDKEAEKILGVYDQASEILVKVDLRNHSLQYYVDKIHTIAPELRIDTYTKRLAAIGVLIDAFNGMAFIITVISVLVAAATIFIMIYINALSRKKHLGILKAIGIKERSAEIAYMIQSFFYALCATVVGVILFYGVVKPYMTIHPIAMPYGDAKLVITDLEVVVSVCVMLVASALAGVLSSRLIVRKPITETVWDK